MNKVKRTINTELPFFLTLPAIVWQCVFIILPLAIIGYYSITSPDVVAWWRKFTLYYYWSVFDITSIRIIFRSLFLSTATALFCLLIAYPMAYYLAFHVKRAKLFLLFLLMLPFWVSFLVQIYAWYFLLEYNGLINRILLHLGIISQPLILVNSQFAVFLLMVYCYLPFMIMPLYNVLEKIDKRLLEASADLGATSWQTFSRITLMLSMPGIRTGFLLVLIPAFGEYVIPSLLGGGKYMMVGTLISYYFLVARSNTIGAAFTIVSALALITFVFVLYSIGKLYGRFTYKESQ